MENEAHRVDTSHIISALIELQMAILAVGRYIDGHSFEWQSIRDAVERVRSTLAVTDHLSATVHPLEQRRLNDLLSEINDRYHLESGVPIVGPPTAQLAKSVREAIWTFAPASPEADASNRDDPQDAWFHTGEDFQPPEDCNHGPLCGNKKELSRWLGETNRRGRLLKSKAKAKAVIVWRKGEKGQSWRVWFQNEGDYSKANGRKAEEENPRMKVPDRS